MVAIVTDAKCGPFLAAAWSLINASVLGGANFGDTPLPAPKFRYRLFPFSHAFPRRTPKPGKLYDTYLPAGLLRAGWLDKHHNQLPAAVVAVFDFDPRMRHADWAPLEAAIVATLQDLRANLSGRPTSLTVVLVQDNVTAPPSLASPLSPVAAPPPGTGDGGGAGGGAGGGGLITDPRAIHEAINERLAGGWADRHAGSGWGRGGGVGRSLLKRAQVAPQAPPPPASPVAAIRRGAGLDGTSVTLLYASDYLAPCVAGAPLPPGVTAATNPYPGYQVAAKVTMGQLEAQLRERVGHYFESRMSATAAVLPRVNSPAQAGLKARLLFKVSGSSNMRAGGGGCRALVVARTPVGVACAWLRSWGTGTSSAATRCWPGITSAPPTSTSCACLAR
jgi:hypothetical protein